MARQFLTDLSLWPWIVRRAGRTSDGVVSAVSPVMASDHPSRGRCEPRQSHRFRQIHKRPIYPCPSALDRTMDACVRRMRSSEMLTIGVSALLFYRFPTTLVKKSYSLCSKLQVISRILESYSIFKFDKKYREKYKDLCHTKKI